MVKVIIYALPMLNQEESSKYKLLTQEQILAHKANELALAFAATQSHENHVLQQTKSLQFHPMQSHHEKGRKKATISFQTHLNNLDQLNMVERTDGAVKITKSSNGKKDIYTAITKDHYYQHKHEPSSSTSDT